MNSLQLVGSRGKLLYMASVFVHIFVSIRVFAFVFVLIVGGWWDLAGQSSCWKQVSSPPPAPSCPPLLPSEMKSSGLARPSQTLAEKLFGRNFQPA